MAPEPRRRRIAPSLDRERLRWPPGRSEVVFALAVIVMVFLFATGQGPWALAPFVIAAFGLLWPTLEEARASFGPKEGLNLEAKRRVDAPYEVEEPEQPKQLE